MKICRHNEKFSKYSENFSKKPLLFVYDNNKNDLIGAVKIVNALKKRGNRRYACRGVQGRRRILRKTQKRKSSIQSDFFWRKRIFLDDTTDFFRAVGHLFFSDFFKGIFLKTRSLLIRKSHKCSRGAKTKYC
ncbi:MAG: hypothetical protein L6V85_06295 [Clostridiales bacterium]|nr:MAG: hypothetical protein L6V85_06295 [Clostridiales bacterium]